MQNNSDLSNILLVLLVLLFSSQAFANECPTIEPVNDQRYLVVISDIHFGVGKTSELKEWDPTEDFRWPQAFTGFLDRISQCGNHAVDLVIAGDALELWQPPKNEKMCKGQSKDARCTLEQFLTLTKIVTKAHQKDFSAIGKFADVGSNRVFFIPGNHDAVLLLSDHWAEVKKAIDSKSGRVFRAETGLWVSEDGKVVVEHGHQIGEDVNGYKKWPNILRKVKGKHYVESSWGEQFVQKLFNEQEVAYPIIDNLSPETAGARFRMADRGLWSSIDDVARFIRFNLFETSLTQKSAALGKNEDPNKPPQWDIKEGRKKGHKLFSLALSKEDPFLQALQGSDNKAVQLRAKLDSLTMDSKKLPDDEVRRLCDQIFIRSKGEELCKKAQLGALFQSSLIFSKEISLTSHINKRIRQEGLKDMSLFIYGHTHLLEEEWSVKFGLPHPVKIYNTGAFQRLVDEKGFLSRAKGKPSDALKSLSVEDLAPCYTAVFVTMSPNLPSAKIVKWHMTEDSGQTGYFTDIEDPVCK